MVKRKIPSPRRESNPRTRIVQPVAQRYTDWAITALVLMYSYWKAPRTFRVVAMMLYGHLYPLSILTTYLTKINLNVTHLLLGIPYESSPKGFFVKFCGYTLPPPSSYRSRWSVQTTNFIVKQYPKVSSRLMWMKGRNSLPLRIRPVLGDALLHITCRIPYACNIEQPKWAASFIICRYVESSTLYETFMNRYQQLSNRL
jgi:hypothetical protein